ncbi:AEC family transporter [Alkalilacustris brevis]|uniref:AEC family transporter n=1 Tax=Alkalilacustris brevis TaxID=2026338 RepID=UPI000E0CE72E|nr:AEC family transporter [Alkalilacustris brevis]
MFVQILAVIAPVLSIVALGYVWAWRSLPFDNATIGSIVLNVGTPCLIFSTLTGADIRVSEVGLIALAAAGVIAVSTAVGVAVLRAARLPLNTYLLTAMHGNSGNMGLPLAAMVFGVEGLALAIAYFLVISISQHTLGLVISAGRVELASLMRQPIVHASALTVLVLLTEAEVPAWIMRTTELLGGLVIPAMLILLGVSLAQLKVGDLRIAFGMSAMRFAAGAAGALTVIFAFGLGAAEAGVVWIMATMPVAVINVIFAERFARSPERIAGVIVVSTLSTLAALPLVVWVALWISGQT